MTHLCPDCKKRYIEHDDISLCDECWDFRKYHSPLEDDYAVADDVRESVDTHE